jgi:uncharacterized membrane protein YcaP (DUF421 family)
MHTLINAVVGYVFLIFIVRILARRPGAQMTPFEFVLIFLIGGLIILATAGEDRSMTNCFGAVVAICFMHRIVASAKQKWPRLGAVIDGTPVVLLKDGEWQGEAMNDMRLGDTDVMASARTKGVRSLDQIKYAVLERNGAISIIKKQSS